MTDLIGTRLNQYELTEIVRRGGMSTVYKAYQGSLDRFVAVKVLFTNRDPQFAARFKREARAIAALQHRNIKPANVLMPSPHWPMLADFGIAKLMNDNKERLTLANQIIGTAAYMAPEQATGRPIDARTDLYAAGVVLYELVTGQVPFDADTLRDLSTKH